MKLNIPLSKISETGTEMIFDDQKFWLDPIEEFNIPCTIKQSIVAKLFLLKQQTEGCLIRGTIQGIVSLPCDRCSDETVYHIDIKLDDFEEMPRVLNASMQEYEEEGDLFPEEASLIFCDKNLVPYLDISSLLWEEFSLALPVKPLCSADCKGICQNCGINQNHEKCVCDTHSYDIRLEKLKNFKVTKK